MLIVKKGEKPEPVSVVGKIADVPNGVTVCTAELTDAVLREGVPLGRGADGMWHVVKMGTVAAAGSSTADVTYVVRKGHNFKVGDFVMAKAGAKAYAITSIVPNAADGGCDDVTVGTSLGVQVSKGDVLMQAAGQSAGTASKFKYEPQAVVGESYDVVPGDSLTVNAWLHAVVNEGRLGFGVAADVKAALRTVSFI